MSSSLESEDKLSPKGAIWAVKEFAETWAIQIALHVSRIGMIEQVEHAQSDFHLPLLGKGKPELSVCLEIERAEAAKTMVVSRTDELARFVYQ